MIVTKDFFGKEYIIVPCTKEMITSHFSKIKTLISKNEWAIVKERMAQSINEGSAFALQDNSCFLYYLITKPHCAEGIAIYGKNSPNKMWALLSGIFIKTDIFKLEFVPHTGGTLIKDYKSILTTISIKRQRIPGHTLVVRVDKLRDKIKDIYKKRGIPWVL